MSVITYFEKNFEEIHSRDLFVSLDEVDRDDELEKYKTFLELEDNGELTSEMIDEIEQLIKKRWSVTPYKIGDVILFNKTLEMIQFAPLKTHAELLKEYTGLIIPPRKLKNNDRIYFMNKITRHYHKTHVQFFYLEHLTKRIEAAFREVSDDGTFTIDMLEDLMFEGRIDQLEVLWIYSLFNSQTSLIESKNNSRPKFINDVLNAIEEHMKLNKDMYVRVYIEMYFVAFMFEYDVIINSPSLLKMETIQSNSELLEENKRLKKRMQKEQKQKNILKKELYETQKEKKELKGDLHELYQESLKEINRLEQVIEQQAKTFEEERKFYLSMIQDLMNQTIPEAQSMSEDEQRNWLKDKTICVIGGEKERYYREVVEDLGAEIVFVAGSDLNLVEGAIKRSDVVFYLTDLVTHAHFRLVVQYSDKYDVPYRFVNGKGIATFKESLERWIGESIKKEEIAG